MIKKEREEKKGKYRMTGIAQIHKKKIGVKRNETLLSNLNTFWQCLTLSLDMI